MNGRSNFARTLVFAFALLACIGSLALTYIISEGPFTNAQNQASAVAIAAQPETEMERAWDRARDMVVAGFASNAAIAASGDAAQASMVRSFTSAVWALALVAVSIAVVVVVLTFGGKTSQQRQHRASWQAVPDENSDLEKIKFGRN